MCLWSPPKPQVYVSESSRQLGDLDEADAWMQVIEVGMQSVADAGVGRKKDARDGGRPYCA